MSDLQIGYENNLEGAIQRIIPYLEDTSSTGWKVIYFDGWDGLGASAVLKAIAEKPPSSLRRKFSKIIHIDCSRWRSRRELQRVIAVELGLPPSVLIALDRQDVTDDYDGVEEASRDEIGDVGRMIHRYLLQYRCLVVFHNGSNDMVDLVSCGIPQPEFFGTKVLWTFRGRLRLNMNIETKIISAKVVGSNLTRVLWSFCNSLLRKEATEIGVYTRNMGYHITPNIAVDCCYYLLSLNHQGGDIMDYKWATHAYNYWVCDGIVGEGQYNGTWGAARALHEQIRLQDYASNTVPSFGHMLETPRARWFCLTDPSERKMTARETTSLFLAFKISGLLPSGMFHQADQLRVLKLCRCTFSFSTPPFHRCQNLRFLGLDSCIDQQKLSGQNENGTAMTMEIFQRLWVLDVCHTDWELDERGEEQLYPYIREVHINNGRIWRGKFAWRQLQNLRKLRVIKPTRSWETGKSDEFITMLNLELLDMTGNNYIQVLPRLSDATGLKTLVLDGCVGLEHVGPEGLPPSLESFSLDVGAEGDHEKDAKLSRVSLAGCARMEDFRVRGCFPNLQELDLSSTAIKMLDLKDMNAQHLQRILLVECQKLRSIAWPAAVMQQLRLLCIDTREGEMVVSEASRDSLVSYVKDARFCRVLISIMDMRFLQSLVYLFQKTPWDERCKMNICFSCKEDNKRGDDIDIKEKMRNIIYCSGQSVSSHVQETALMSKQAGRTYHDISMEQLMTTRTDDKGIAFQPEDLHLEIGVGVSDVTDEISAQGSKAIPTVINKIQSLYVHENSFITTVIPLHIILFGRTEGHEITWSSLKRCLVERCPKLDTVFTINYDYLCFEDLDTIWVAHLLMARSIWSRGTTHFFVDKLSFAKLRVIHLRFCPRLTFVLPLAWFYTLSRLETLEIVCCADLKLVFPVDEEFLNRITAGYANGMLEFPELKRLYLYHLSNLQQICEAKMLAPKLEKIYVRGCWGLRRLPATDDCHRDRPVAVDCEKDWWGNLEWDGLNIGHHPSLFAPRHSKYYKRKLLKGTVLR